MIQYIIDASIIVQLFVEDTHTSETRVLFRGIEDSHRLILPEFALLECANVLWKQVRFNNVSVSIARDHVIDLLGLDLEIAPVLGLLPHALEIGLRHQLAIYDSVYIALAKQMRLPLITDDNKQAQAAQLEGVVLKAITDFHP